MDCANGIKAMCVYVVELAYNHIMDHGVKGLRTTIDALQYHGIAHVVGAGENLYEAQRIQIPKVNGIRIGILAITEHEFGIADSNSLGANPLNVMDIVRNISVHKSEYEKLIILLHGGNGHYPYP